MHSSPNSTLRLSHTHTLLTNSKFYLHTISPLFVVLVLPDAAPADGVVVVVVLTIVVVVVVGLGG